MNTWNCTVLYTCRHCFTRESCLSTKNYFSVKKVLIVNAKIFVIFCDYLCDREVLTTQIKSWYFPYLVVNKTTSEGEMQEKFFTTENTTMTISFTRHPSFS
jgi:hypothetical protein